MKVKKRTRCPMCFVEDGDRGDDVGSIVWC